MSAESILAEWLRFGFAGKKLPVTEFTKLAEHYLSVATSIEPAEVFYRSRSVKRIREEVYPLSIFLKSGFLEITYVEPSSSYYANYDGKLFLRNNDENHFEVTCAKDGEFELFRGRHLEEFDIAPVDGVTTQELYEALSNGIPALGEAVNLSDRIECYVKEVQERIEAKSTMNYPRDTVLIVAFDCDFRKPTFEAVARLVRAPSQSIFSHVFLVGICGEYCARIMP